MEEQEGNKMLMISEANRNRVLVSLRAGKMDAAHISEMNLWIRSYALDR